MLDALPMLVAFEPLAFMFVVDVVVTEVSPRSVRTASLLTVREDALLSIDDVPLSTPTITTPFVAEPSPILILYPPVACNLILSFVVTADICWNAGTRFVVSVVTLNWSQPVMLTSFPAPASISI